jgi:hypothetical protein
MNGCRIHGNKELSMLAAEQILRMAPNSDGAYVSLSHVYAEDGELAVCRGHQEEDG